MSDGGPNTPAIDARDVWVRFLIRYHRAEVTLRETFVKILSAITRTPDPSSAAEDFWALRGINFTAQPGEIVGIVGRNGSGKSTLLKTLAGIYEADRGSVVVRGKVGCLLSFGVGFNHNLSGRENVFLNGSILGLTRRQIAARFQQIVDFAELGAFIDAPVRTYSAGMRGRLGFAIAIHIEPDVLLLDEVLGVGDTAFRAKAGSIVDHLHRAQKTVVIASHSMSLIADACTRAIWVEKGAIRMDGDPRAVTDAYVAASGVKLPAAAGGAPASTARGAAAAGTATGAASGASGSTAPGRSRGAVDDSW